VRYFFARAGENREGVGEREFPVWGDRPRRNVEGGQEGGSPIESEASEIVLPGAQIKIPHI